MTTLSMADWLSPAQLADELSRDGQTVTADWVRVKMAAGLIPSVKVGNRRWFTPQCREAMERRATEPTRDAAGFGRVTRVKRGA